MNLRIGAITIDTNDVTRASEFWKAVTGYDVSSADESYVFLADPQGRGPALGLQKVPEPRAGKNRLHLDLLTGDLAGEVDRVKALGASQVEQHSDGGNKWTVLSDTDGNLFCIVAE